VTEFGRIICTEITLFNDTESITDVTRRRMSTKQVSAKKNFKWCRWSKLLTLFQCVIPRCAWADLGKTIKKFQGRYPTHRTKFEQNTIEGSKDDVAPLKKKILEKSQRHVLTLRATLRRGSIFHCNSATNHLCHTVLPSTHRAIYMSRDSVVGIATDYGLDDRGVGVPVLVGSRIFSSRRLPDQHWGPAKPPIQWYRGFFHQGKAAGAWSWPLTSN
jgi:hypothetical protein